MKARQMHLTMWYAGHKPHHAKIAALDRSLGRRDYDIAKLTAAHAIAFYGPAGRP